ncbi:MAG TPA: hypothetical protein VNF06_01725 [Candidatus Aquilonibacter sp.]|nr:hypothetical protein [Candidatus Aquilonibacter sp.]
MSVQKSQNQSATQSEAIAVVVALRGHIEKREVQKMLEYPGMGEKMVSSAVGGILELYQNSGNANKAISTVLTETSYHSILREKVSGRANGDLEGKVSLYSNSVITEHCNDAVILGADKMVYSLNMLHNALGGNMEWTLEVLDWMGEMKSKHDMGFALTTVLTINEKVKGAKGKEVMKIAKECVEYMFEFKRLNYALSQI